MKTIYNCILTFFLLPVFLHLNLAAQDKAAVSEQESIKKIQKSIEIIRNRKFTREVKTGRKSSEEIKTFLNKSFKEEFDPVLFYYTTLYREFHLLSAKADLRKIMLALLTSQIGGFYDPKERTFYLSKSYMSFSEIIISHELMHALQDCYVSLENILYLEDLGFVRDAKAKNDDIHLARLSFFEGEAQFVSTQYIAGSGLAMDPDFLLEQASPDMLTSQLQMSLTPQIITSQLLFPYIKGLSCFTALYVKSGWAGINRRYKELPCSTEQIIHPEKLIKGEKPVFVEIPLSGPAEAGWELNLSNSLGEFHCSEIVKGLTGGFVKGLRAAAGWGGDSLYLYTKGSQYILVWYAVWDTPKDASEFSSYFTEGYLGKQPDSSKTEKDTDRFTVSGKRAVLFYKNGLHTVFISAPNRDLLKQAGTWARTASVLNWKEYIDKMKKNTKRREK